MDKINSKQKIVIIFAITIVVAGNLIALFYYLGATKPVSNTQETTETDSTFEIPLTITPEEGNINSPVLNLQGNTLPYAKISFANKTFLANELGNFKVSLNLKPGKNSLQIKITSNTDELAKELVYTFIETPLSFSVN